MEPNSNALYVSGGKRNDHSEFGMYQIDPNTGKTLATANSGLGYPIWSMATCDMYSTSENPVVIGIFDAYLYAPMDPMQPVFNTAMVELGKTGASSVVAIAAGGSCMYYHPSFNMIPAQLLYILDDLGNMWKAYIYTMEGYDGSLYYQVGYETVPHVGTDLPALDFRVRDVVKERPLSQEQDRVLTQAVESAAGKVLKKLMFAVRDHAGPEALRQCLSAMEQVTRDA